VELNEKNVLCKQFENDNLGERKCFSDKLTNYSKVALSRLVEGK
jgi:hypothetical protein